MRFDFELSKKSLPARKGALVILYKNGKAKLYDKVTDKTPFQPVGFISSFNGQKIRMNDGKFE